MIKAHCMGKVRNISSIDFISKTVTVGRTKHHTVPFEKVFFLSPLDNLNVFLKEPKE